MQLDPLIRPLAAGDAVVHVGPGVLRGHAAYPATAATVVLVEADPARARLLPLKLQGRDAVRLVAAALRPAGASQPLIRYNLGELDGFRPPTGAYRLFPGLRALGREPVATIDPAQLLELLPPPQGRDVLILEAAGEEREVLAGLDRLGALGRFATIVLRTGCEALFEAGGTAAALTGWLAERGFADPVTLDDADPDWPVLQFSADPVRKLVARLRELEPQAGGDGWVTLSDLREVLEAGGRQQDRGEKLRDLVQRRASEHAEARSALLVEAQKLLADRLAELEADGAVTPNQAEIFRVQLDQLRHELSLALRRGQLDAGPEPQPLARRSVAQLGQDLWVLERTGHKRGGFFVEFGATDGLHLSNTWLLETEFGWQGICAEPNPAFFEALKANRRCTVAPDCIHDRTGAEVEFILADEYGVIADHADLDQHAGKRAAFRDGGRTIRLTTISLDDFLRKHDAPRRIDYVSIDTEGTEFLILDAFPFDAWDIGLFTVEHNHTPNRDRVRALMERHGYACRPADFDDWFFRP